MTLSGSESSQIPGKQLSLAWFVRDGCIYPEECVILGCHDKKPQSRGLQQEAFVFSWFWTLRVQDQAAGAVSISETSLLGLQTMVFSPCLVWPLLLAYE